MQLSGEKIWPTGFASEFDNECDRESSRSVAFADKSVAGALRLA